MDTGQHKTEEKRDSWTLGEVRLLGIYRDVQGTAWLFLGRPWRHSVWLPCIGFADHGDFIAVKISFPLNQATNEMMPKEGDVIPEYAEDWAEEHQIDWDVFSLEQGLIAPDDNPMLVGVVKMPNGPPKELRAVDE
jgi:hypothetical protein